MRMPDDEGFERDLVRVVRDGAPDAAPSTLRERVALAMTVWPVQPAVRATTWLLGAAAGVAALLVVALLWPRSAALPGTTPPGATLGATATGSPGITGSPPSNGTLLDHPGIVQVGQLITASSGVVMNVDGRVLITSSGGATWRDITPDGADVPNAERFFFLDPRRGWLATYDPMAPTGLVIWRTVDGGSTWAGEAIPTLQSVNWDLAFLSPELGWLASDPGGEAPKPELRWSHDGGATWDDPIDLAAATGVPTLGLVTFFDGSNGVMTRIEGGEERILRTSDGGRSWSPPQMNGAQGDILTATSRYGPVQVIDSATALIVVDLLYGDGATVGQVIIETFDAGASWTARYGDARRRSWAFVDATHWIATDGENVWATDDGGTSWGEGTSSGLPVPLEDAAMHFVDPLNGWARAVGGSSCPVGGSGSCAGPGRFFELLKTFDGGFTWSLVGSCDPNNELSFVCPTPKPS